MGIQTFCFPNCLGIPGCFPPLPTEEVPGGPLESGSRCPSPGLPSRGVVSSFWVDICDSAFSPWMVLLLPRPSRDHGSGRHGVCKGRMEMLPAALCVSGFVLRVPPLVHFLSLPLLRPSTQEQSGLCQEREMTSGEGRVCPVLHSTPASHLLCPHIRADGGGREGGHA